MCSDCLSSTRAPKYCSVPNSLTCQTSLLWFASFSFRSDKFSLKCFFCCKLAGVTYVPFTPQLSLFLPQTLLKWALTIPRRLPPRPRHPQIQRCRPRPPLAPVPRQNFMKLHLCKVVSPNHLPPACKAQCSHTPVCDGVAAVVERAANSFIGCPWHLALAAMASMMATAMIQWRSEWEGN